MYIIRYILYQASYETRKHIPYNYIAKKYRPDISLLTLPYPAYFYIKKPKILINILCRPEEQRCTKTCSKWTLLVLENFQNLDFD